MSDLVFDRHYRRYRRAVLPATARSADAPRTPACPEVGTFTIADEVFWLLVVAAQLGWPLPRMVQSLLTAAVSHKFDVDTLRFLVRKEPLVSVLDLAIAGTRVRGVEPEWARGQLRSLQASQVSLRDDPTFGPWPEPTDQAEAAWEKGKRDWITDDDSVEVATSAHRVTWLALALAQAGWPMPAAVTRRFPAYWVNQAVPARRLARVLGKGSNFTVADAVLAGIQVDGLNPAMVIKAVERQVGVAIDLPDLSKQPAFKRLWRSFPEDQFQALDLGLLAYLAERMRGILIGRDQNSGQRLTFDTFLLMRSRRLPVPDLVSDTASGPANREEECSPVVASNSATSEVREPSQQEAEDDKSSAGDQMVAAKPQPSPASLTVIDGHARMERRIQQYRQAEEQQEKLLRARSSAYRAGLIKRDDKHHSLEDLERMLAIHKEESDKKFYRDHAKLREQLAGVRQRIFSEPGEEQQDEDGDDDDEESADEADSDERKVLRERTHPASSNPAGPASHAHDVVDATPEAAVVELGGETADGELTEAIPTDPRDHVQTSVATSSSAEVLNGGGSPAEDVMSMTDRQAEQLAMRDLATLMRRSGYPLTEEQMRHLPDDWKAVRLTIRRIVELIPYPRAVPLGAAFVAMGYNPIQSLEFCDEATVASLAAQASAERERVRDLVNSEEPKILARQHGIPRRWERALKHMRVCRKSASGSAISAEGPEPWDLLCAPHSTTASDEGFRLVCQLDAIFKTYRALNGDRDKGAVLRALGERNPFLRSMTALASQQPHREQFLTLALRAWNDAWAEQDIDELLPGFVS